MPRNGSSGSWLDPIAWFPQLNNGDIDGFESTTTSGGAAVGSASASGGARGDPDASRRLIQEESSNGAVREPKAPNLDIEEVLYALNAFWATLKPVTLTLLLSSLAVVYLSMPSSGDDSMVAYQIDDNEDSKSQKLGKSVMNALIIVGFIAFVTFALVFLYWLGCTKFLMGYMILSSSMLLALLGGLLWYTALVLWEVPFDAITFFFILWNFAVVGVIAIFYQKGIPTIVTQGYLVCTSVILAWNLSKFDEWTTWALLVGLAMWDLFAVLTPCGPLKMLVNLMQTRNDPLPGLLYEAELPPPPQQFRDAAAAAASAASASTAASKASGKEEDPHYPHHTDSGSERMFPMHAPGHEPTARTQSGSSAQGSATVKIPAPATLGLGVGLISHLMASKEPKLKATKAATSTYGSNDSSRRSSSSSSSGSSSGYSSIDDSDTGAAVGTAIDVSETGPTGDLTVNNSSNGSSNSNANGRGSYNTLPPSSPPQQRAPEPEEKQDYSIKLGLGDFVFYSVLVSRASMYGFCTGVICALIIVGGLGVTLVLLSVYRKALPALPISILLGFVFYLGSRFFIVPFLEDVLSNPLYV